MNIDTIGLDSNLNYITDTNFYFTRDSIPISYVYTNNVEKTKTGTQKMQLQYIAIPIFLSQEFNFNKHQLSVKTGLQINILINQKSILNNLNNDQKLYAKPYYLNYQLGLSYAYELTPKTKLYTDFIYRQSMQNYILKEASTLQTFGIQLGVRYFIF